MTGWSWGSSRTDHVQLQVSKLGVLKPPICSICQGWWYTPHPTLAYLGLLRAERDRPLGALGPDAPATVKKCVRIPPDAVSFSDPTRWRLGAAPRMKAGMRRLSPRKDARNITALPGRHSGGILPKIENRHLTSHGAGSAARVWRCPSRWTGSSRRPARRARCHRALRSHQGARSGVRDVQRGLSRDASAGGQSFLVGAGSRKYPRLRRGRRRSNASTLRAA